MDGHWDEINCNPPEGTFAPEMQVPTVHFDATDKVTKKNQHYDVNYFIRTNQIQTTNGFQYDSQGYVLVSGDTITTPEKITIPDMEITGSDIPAPYHPIMKFPGPDAVVEKNGKYYLTGATIEVAANGTTTYYGKHETVAVNGRSSLANRVTFAAPVSIEYDDLDGNPYNAWNDSDPDHFASYSKVVNIHYGDDLNSDQAMQLGNNYLDSYVRSVWGESDPGFEIVGNFKQDGQRKDYFDADGRRNENKPQLEDAHKDSDHFTLHFAIAYRVWGPVENTQTTKTRTIIVHTPTGREQTVKQRVTLAQFNYHDGITGDDLPGEQTTWLVLTPDEDPDNNDS